MLVTGISGERIGTVERFEIDRTGQLNSVVVTLASRGGTRKRIAADKIRSIRDGAVQVAVTPAEISTLADAIEPSLDGI